MAEGAEAPKQSEGTSFARKKEKQMASKVGLTYTKARGKNKLVLASLTGDFISVVDGVTFGIMEGRRFHSVNSNWSNEEQDRWAKANSAFFKQLSNNLAAYANCVEKVRK